LSKNCRFTVAVHVCALLAHNNGEPATSEWIAESVNTNPVVIRRTLSALAKAGLVKSWRGSNGGSILARAPRAIALAEIYRAVDDSEGPALHQQPPKANCPIGAHIQPVLTEMIAAAEAAREKIFAAQSLADVMSSIRKRAA
jgi:Rrf2 family protein